MTAASKANPTSPAVGDVIAGKYRILRVLGEGGMGCVYAAVHTRLEQPVALKMLLPVMAQDPENVVRFEREARAAGRLRGPHTVRIMDVEVSESGLPFLVMELLEGCDLATLITHRGPIPFAEAVDYLLQACAAMAEAHEAGIVHRDLKPSNLFVVQDGVHNKIKVLDFGISKILSEQDARVTSTHVAVGTPLYMSPEQVRSKRTVDGRTDIWSLGIILFELLTGKTPFDGSPTSVAASIVSDEPPTLQECGVTVPPELEIALRKALAKNPQDRFPDVVSFAEQLLPFADRSSAGPVSLHSAKISRPRVVIGQGALAISGSMASVDATGKTMMVSSGSAHPPFAGADAEDSATELSIHAKRKRRVWFALATVCTIGVGIAAGLVLARKPQAPQARASVMAETSARPLAVAPAAPAPSGAPILPNETSALEGATVEVSEAAVDAKPTIVADDDKKVTGARTDHGPSAPRPSASAGSRSKNGTRTKEPGKVPAATTNPRTPPAANVLGNPTLL
jgi:serine/threonine-protein kinase